MKPLPKKTATAMSLALHSKLLAVLLLSNNARLVQHWDVSTR
jgi:hypothetical protein